MTRFFTVSVITLNVIKNNQKITKKTPIQLSLHQLRIIFIFFMSSKYNKNLEKYNISTIFIIIVNYNKFVVSLRIGFEIQRLIIAFEFKIIIQFQNLSPCM